MIFHQFDIGVSRNEWQKCFGKMFHFLGCGPNVIKGLKFGSLFFSSWGKKSQDRYTEKETKNPKDNETAEVQKRWGGGGVREPVRGF